MAWLGYAALLFNVQVWDDGPPPKKLQLQYHFSREILKLLKGYDILKCFVKMFLGKAVFRFM